MDLLTAVLHELGHVAGLADQYGEPGQRGRDVRLAAARHPPVADPGGPGCRIRGQRLDRGLIPSSHQTIPRSVSASAGFLFASLAVFCLSAFPSLAPQNASRVRGRQARESMRRTAGERPACLTDFGRRDRKQKARLSGRSWSRGPFARVRCGSCLRATGASLALTETWPWLENSHRRLDWLSVRRLNVLRRRPVLFPRSPLPASSFPLRRCVPLRCPAPRCVVSCNYPSVPS